MIKIPCCLPVIQLVFLILFPCLWVWVISRPGNTVHKRSTLTHTWSHAPQGVCCLFNFFRPGVIYLELCSLPSLLLIALRIVRQLSSWSIISNSLGIYLCLHLSGPWSRLLLLLYYLASLSSQRLHRTVGVSFPVQKTLERADKLLFKTIQSPSEWITDRVFPSSNYSMTPRCTYQSRVVEH